MNNKERAKIDKAIHRSEMRSGFKECEAMAKKKKRLPDKEGICPNCRSAITPNEEASHLDGDGIEETPFKCEHCGHEGTSVRILMFSHFE